MTASSTRKIARAAEAIPSPAELEAAIRALGVDIAARADESEAARRPPQDLFERLAATGIFKMLWPIESGGFGFTQAEALPVIEALAAADGSAGWSTMIGAESAALWMRFADFAPTARSAAYGVLTRPSLIPRGVARRTPKGWHLKGRWPLASGAYDADWFIASAQVMDGDAPALRPDGLPDARQFAVPPDSVKVIETWQALGLRSTMSHDIEVDAELPANYSAPALGVVDSPYPLGRLPVWFALGPFHCAVVLGITTAALDDVLALLPAKRPVLNPAIRTCDDPIVQHAIGAAATRLSAARAFLMSEVHAAWAMAEAKAPFTPIVRARFRSMLTLVHAECVAVMDQLFHLGGSSPVYDSSSLQRRYRDLRTACQHVTANTEIYRPYGALLLGAPLANEAML